MIICIDAEKAFDKIIHTFMIKNSPGNRHRRSLTQHDNSMYDKPTESPILNGEKLIYFF